MRDTIVSVLPYLIPIIIVILLIIIAALGVVKTPANEAAIISGLSKEPRVIAGKLGFMIPFLERKDTLFLGQISVDVRTGAPVPTKDYIKVNVDAIAKIELNLSTDEQKAKAIKNFLNMDYCDIANSITESLSGNLKEVIGALTLVELNINRDSFSKEVQRAATPDMAELGIKILSCNIQSVNDQTGLIEDLGAENTSNIKMKSAKVRAEAEKEIMIAQAIAKKAARDQEIQTEREIAEKETELDIKKSELKQSADIARADADAAYKIRYAEQQKSINAATVAAETEKMEKTAALKEAEIVLKEKELDATVRKQADADKYARQIKAEADFIEAQKKADSDKYKAEQIALAKKASADADRYEKEQQALAAKAAGEAEAEVERLTSIAEADGIKAQGLAEAESMSKKAEAYAKYNNAAIANMIVDILPQMAAEISKSIAQIGNITIYGGNGENGTDPVAGMNPAIMKQVFDMISSTTGVDFSEIVKAATYDAKVTKNVTFDGSVPVTDVTPYHSDSSTNDVPYYLGPLGYMNGENVEK